MGRFNLNDPIDFAKVTSSTLQGLLGAFGRDPREWDILEASYNDLVFHVFESDQDFNGALPQITDSGGRRKVKYLFPYKDGQALDDLGAQPESFDLEILLFGDKYKNAFIKLFAELNKPQPGVLVHPVRGRIKCAMEDFTNVHEASTRKAVLIRLKMIQSSFTVASFGTIAEDNTVKGALGRVLDAFKTIDNVITKVESTTIFVTAVKNEILDLVESYKTAFGKTSQRMNNSFNEGSSEDLPTLSPINRGGAIGLNGDQFDTFTEVVTPEEAFKDVPSEELATVGGVIDTLEAEKEVNALREDVDEIIVAIDEGSEVGSIEFHDDIVDLKETALLMQDVLEKGVASSQVQVVEYITPRLMSIREVAFENGVSVDGVEDIEILNPDLLSVNFIEIDTTLRIPVTQ